MKLSVHFPCEEQRHLIDRSSVMDNVFQAFGTRWKLFLTRTPFICLRLSLFKQLNERVQMKS